MPSYKVVGYQGSYSAPYGAERLTFHLDKPCGSVNKLNNVVNYDLFPQYFTDSGAFPGALHEIPYGYGMFYPVSYGTADLGSLDVEYITPGYALEWVSDKVSVSGSGTSVILSFDDTDINALSMGRFFQDYTVNGKSYTRCMVMASSGMIPASQPTNTPPGTVVAGRYNGLTTPQAHPVQSIYNTDDDIYNAFDRQYPEAHSFKLNNDGETVSTRFYFPRNAVGITPQRNIGSLQFFWTNSTAAPLFFEVMFNGHKYELGIDTVYRPWLQDHAYVSEEMVAPLPVDTAAGPVRVRIKMSNGFYTAYSTYINKPYVNLATYDGVGEYSGMIVSAAGSFGFTDKLTKARWCLGGDISRYMTPSVFESQFNGQDHNQFADETLASFTDHGLYVEDDNLSTVHDVSKVCLGVYRQNKQPLDQNGDALHGAKLTFNRVALSVAGEDTDYLKYWWNGSDMWPWQRKPIYEALDVETTIEKALSPRCPISKPLSGSCGFTGEYFTYYGTWGYIEYQNEIYATQNFKLTGPFFIDLFGQKFNNYSGYAGTSNGAEQYQFAAYNVATKTWDLILGSISEGFSMPSVLWTDEYALVTLSHLLDGTLASLAWKQGDGATLLYGIPSFDLYFKKSIDDGVTWVEETLVKENVRPFLTRARQNLFDGKYIIENKYESSDGGANWTPWISGGV